MEPQNEAPAVVNRGVRKRTIFMARLFYNPKSSMPILGVAAIATNRHFMWLPAQSASRVTNMKE
jgi:hypothetical protein